MKRFGLLSPVIICVLVVVPAAQLRVVPVDEERGHVALGLALRHLANTGIFMQTTAHPDDENNGLLVMLNRGQGYRTALATATRGNGGQNEIGPEIFEALGVLRTEELAALHRFDGAEQYFTRAVDFGYSFSLDETFEKWGKDEITADYVRLMRTVRPDVVIGLMPGGAGGGQHHQASALITREAVKLAGDPAKYPEQVKEGLRPWQPRKFYYSAGFGFPGEPPVTGRTLRVNLAVYDPLLGRTYAEVGTEARSMHKCQGMAQLLSLPGPAASTYQLTETTIPSQMQADETSLFDGIDSTIPGLAAFAGPRPPQELNVGLAAVASAVQAAQKGFDAVGDAATLKPLVDGLVAARALRRAVRSMSVDEAAQDEVDFRLRQKETEFEQAILLANAVRLEALAEDGVVVPGQMSKVSVIVANRGGAPVTVKEVTFDGFESAAGGRRPSGPRRGDVECTLMRVTAPQGFGGGMRGRGSAPTPAGPPVSTLTREQAGQCDVALEIPGGAKITAPYWHRQGEEGRYTFDRDAPFGLPFRPTPFSVQVTLAVSGDGNGDAGARSVDVTSRLAVEHRYEGDIFSGEKRTELLVVPALSVRITPEIAIVPAALKGPASEREIRVTVVNDLPGAAKADVHLEPPRGWTAAPAGQTLAFEREDEPLTVRFTVHPEANTPTGEYQVRAVATVNGQAFARGYQVIEYPHIRRYHVYDDARATVKVIDVRTQPNLTIGYVMGVGDQVPPAIEQLGARVEMIGADDLAWGDLSRFDAIVTGVRAYERRDDLRANNKRLLEYVFNGGTAIVQYNKFEFNDAQYGPYPARVSSNRVTDESAPATVLAPDDPVLTTPNVISASTWKGWVQERGLYFLGEKDPRYRDLVQLEDPFPYNRGPKSGALVEATYGKGRWVYVGLGLWRQLPAGTDGAYQLLANLISLGTAKTASSR
jgi:LmbE family N-acetylglucosaminyl deacetylase